MRFIESKPLFMAIVLFSFLGVFTSACTQDKSPSAVSEQFWQAVMKRDMETAKQLSTWDTVDYLKYLKSKKLHPERFVLENVMLGENRAEIATTLYTTRQGKSGVKVPGVTVLVKIEQGWRVDVKKTLGSVVERTVDNVINQLDGFLQQGLNELDKSLSESLDELGKVIEDGAKELRKELARPLHAPQKQQQGIPSLGEHNGRPI